MNSAEVFGVMLGESWADATLKLPFSEVQLFRAFRAAILALSPPFKIEEFHGSRHQVAFAGAGSWARTVARCELSDLMIVAYKTKPRLAARLTFLQAKKSEGKHSLCRNHPRFDVTTSFSANLEQWDLLSRRPPIIGIPPFNPPADLLGGAILPSVGSFGVFHRVTKGRHGFFYASGDMLKPLGYPTRKYAALSTLPNAGERITYGFAEKPLTCCISIFGRELYSGRIGTPIDKPSEVSSEDHAYREATRRWLARLLQSHLRQTEGSRPVTTLLLDALEVREEVVVQEPISPHIMIIHTDELQGAR